MGCYRQKAGSVAGFFMGYIFAKYYPINSPLPSFFAGRKILLLQINLIMEDLTSTIESNEQASHMNSLALCLNKLVLKGYDDDFRMTDTGLKSLNTNKIYQPEDIHISNFYRFEGQSDPNDNSILYVVESDDGNKGTIVDAYGPYADKKLSDFMTKVEDITKKIKA